VNNTDSRATSNNPTPPKPSSSKPTLSAARIAFVQRLRKLRSGRILGLVIHEGQPVLHHDTKCFNEYGLGQGSETWDQEMPMTNLNQHFHDLFVLFDRVQNGTIEFLEIKDGLPVRVFVEDKGEGK